jgi:N-acetylglucosaminyldiphosphoundecaprenol N-acetyl-beta-D-mannosaminyltransferase
MVATTAAEPSAVRLLGVTVHRLTLDHLKAIVAGAIEKNERRIIANHNLHSVYLYHHDAAARAFYATAAYVHIDGMPLVFFGRLLGLPLGRQHRLTPLDWIRPLSAEAARRGWRMFYLGSKPGVAEKGAAILRREFPGLQLDAAHGYFDPRPDSEENRAVGEAINRCRPHLLMVGMGMPRQERWILENVAELPANAIFNVGALMDYIAGEVPTPPRWMGRAGLEWLFRLLSQPRHLWRRYLVEPWFVLRLFVSDLARRSGSGNGS